MAFRQHAKILISAEGVRSQCTHKMGGRKMELANACVQHMCITVRNILGGSYDSDLQGQAYTACMYNVTMD